MPRDVIISIKPEWVEKIISGEKTIELRKSFPNQPTPFRCFIYVTKDFKPDRSYPTNVWKSRGKVIGECDIIDFVEPYWNNGETSIYYKMAGDDCLMQAQRMAYLSGKRGYGWIMKWLEIYDTPRPLSDFDLDRAPQSWCYVPNHENY